MAVVGLKVPLGVLVDVEADLALAQLLEDVVDFGLEVLLLDAVKGQVGRNKPALVGQTAARPAATTRRRRGGRARVVVALGGRPLPRRCQRNALRRRKVRPNHYHARTRCMVHVRRWAGVSVAHHRLWAVAAWGRGRGWAVPPPLPLPLLPPPRRAVRRARAPT
jgi:hypothetical protein